MWGPLYIGTNICYFWFHKRVYVIIKHVYLIKESCLRSGFPVLVMSPAETDQQRPSCWVTKQCTHAISKSISNVVLPNYTAPDIHPYAKHVSMVHRRIHEKERKRKKERSRKDWDTDFGSDEHSSAHIVIGSCIYPMYSRSYTMFWVKSWITTA